MPDEGPIDTEVKASTGKAMSRRKFLGLTAGATAGFALAAAGVRSTSVEAENRREPTPIVTKFRELADIKDQDRTKYGEPLGKVMEEFSKLDKLPEGINKIEINAAYYTSVGDSAAFDGDTNDSDVYRFYMDENTRWATSSLGSKDKNPNARTEEFKPEDMPKLIERLKGLAPDLHGIFIAINFNKAPILPGEVPGIDNLRKLKGRDSGIEPKNTALGTLSENVEFLFAHPKHIPTLGIPGEIDPTEIDFGRQYYIGSVVETLDKKPVGVALGSEIFIIPHGDKKPVEKNGGMLNKEEIRGKFK